MAPPFGRESLNALNHYFPVVPVVTGILAHQSIGAMIALVLFGIWIARGHLRGVFRKAFIGDASIDDSDEIMSYRTAVR